MAAKQHSIWPGLWVGLALGLFLAWIFGLNAANMRSAGLRSIEQRTMAGQKRVVATKAEINALTIKLTDLKKRYLQFSPQDIFLIVNTADNLFVLRTRDTVIRKGVCSTGSYTLLRTTDGKKEWIFKTPRGMLRVLKKTESPVWRMPDWAYVEEGKPIPPPDSPERFQTGVLGDYSLSLGDGYLIHGTLYQRFLGLAVTHGCVRLGDDDLEAVYQNVKIGSKIFIY